MDWVGRFDVREKGPADLVTQADLASQKAIREFVLGHFPDHGFLGEEDDGASGGHAEYVWVVDPLDGTTNYVHRNPQFAVSVALVRVAEVVAGAVFDPSSGECFMAERGSGAFLDGKPIAVSSVQSLSDALVAVSFSAKVDEDSPQIPLFLKILTRAQAIRRTGSAALNLAGVACGRFDAYWATDNKPWDVAAGLLLVEEAGGVNITPEGGAVDVMAPRLAVAATVELQRDLCAVLT
jgi:myo-inositol-1(or 4)-monophosphatase